MFQAPTPMASPLPQGPAHALSTGPLVTAARALIAVGIAVALFIAYEFLITGMLFSRSQEALLTAFKQSVVTGSASGPAAIPAEGEPVALIDIPSIGLDRVVIDGTSPDDLKQGPGHLRNSPLPGEFGNAVIIGRRTTYGGPFAHLDRLGKGDGITVTTGQGSFVYTVRSVDRTGAGIPDPLNGSLDVRLTLITSDPAYVPDGRLAVVATLRGSPTEVPSRAQDPVAATDLGLSGEPVGLGLAFFWGMVLAAVVVLARRVAAEWPARVRYLVCAPIVLALVVLVFSNLDRALPGTL